MSGRQPVRRPAPPALGGTQAEAVSVGWVGPNADCPAVADDGYYCTLDEGHTAGDLPHVAVAAIAGVVAIWDDAGHRIELAGDRSNKGQTL